MNFEFIQFLILLDCNYSNFFSKYLIVFFVFRTPPPPAIAGDPLRVRLFPSDSDEELPDDQPYL